MYKKIFIFTTRNCEIR